MSRPSTIELHKESMKFSSGHFTVFSETKRERLHGHNYTVYAAFTTLIDDNGLSFDYRDYKEQLFSLCNELNQAFLLPENCKFLKLVEQDEYINVHFNGEKIPFLKNDVVILPVNNITVEELSNWFKLRLIEDKNKLQENHIQEILVKVASSPGQSGSSTWKIQQ